MIYSTRRTSRPARAIFAIVLTGVVLLQVTQTAMADELAERGRAVLEKWKSSVVTVQMVTAVSMGTGSQKVEDKAEATGTIIDPSGLVVFSLTSSDPTLALGKMMGMFGGSGDSGMQAEVTDIKIRLPGGEELPSEIVLRDRDLDLVFVRLNEKPSSPLSAVNLADPTSPKALDEVVVLNRLGNVANWTTSARLDRIEAVVEKPRTYYLLGDDLTLGAPVFALDGKIVGIMLLRTGTTRPSMGAFLEGISGMGMLPIILPAEDIAEVAQQVGESSE